MRGEGGARKGDLGEDLGGLCLGGGWGGVLGEFLGGVLGGVLGEGLGRGDLRERKDLGREKFRGRLLGSGESRWGESVVGMEGEV